MPKGDKTSKFGVAQATPSSSVTNPLQTQSQSPVSAFGVPYSDKADSFGEGVSVNPDTWSEYERLSSHPFASDPSQQNLANLQSGWEKAKNAVAGGVVNIGAGFLDAIGSWDVKDTFDMAAGVDKEYGNWFHDRAKELSAITQNSFPIYERDPGSVSPSDPGWWANQAQSLGFTIGYAGEALAEQLVLAAVTGGAGNEVAAATKLKALQNLSRAARINTSKEALWGAFKGLQEATTNGYQTFDETKQKYIGLGYSEEKATKLASVAASEGFKAETGPLMALNALQYATLAFNPVTGKGSSIYKNIGNSALRHTAEVGTEMLSEGLEEGWQTIASDYGKEKADVTAGLTPDRSFSAKLKDYIQQADTWNSAIGGLLGGTMFTGGQYIKNAIAPNLYEKNIEKGYKQYEEGLKGMTIKYLQDIKQAEDSGQPEKANQLRQDMSVQQALQSYHIDQLRGEKGVLNSHLSTLKGILDAANSGDQETLNHFKISGDQIDNVKATFPNLISDANNAINIYNNIKNTNDESVLIPLAYRQHLLGKLTQEEASASQSINSSLASIPDAQNLSARGQQLLATQYQHEAMTLEEERLKTLLKNSSGTQADNIREVLNNIGLHKQSLESIRDTILSQETSPEEGKFDQDILRAIPHQSELLKAQQRQQAAESEISRTRKELAILSDKKYQISNAEEKRERLINEAETPAQVDAISNTLQQNRQLTPKLKNKADLKKKDLEAQKVGITNTQTARQNEVIVPEVKPEAETVTSDSFTPKDDTKPPNTDLSEDYSITREKLAEGLDFSNNNTTDEVIKESDWNTPTNNNTPIVEETLAFFPDKVNPEATDEQKERVKQKVKDYVEQLGIDWNKEPSEITFREFLTDTIKHSDKNTVEKNFDYLKEGWKLNGYKATNFDRDYKALFGSRLDLAAEMFNSINEAKNAIQSPEELATKVDETTIDTIDKTQDTKTEELETGEKVVRTEFKTVNPSLKLAFLNVEYTEQEVIDEDGNVRVVKVDADDLLKGSDIDSRSLMNPGLYLPGTKLSVGVPLDSYGDVIVTQWSSDYKKKEGISFNSWVARNNIEPNSKEWNDKIPIIVRNSDGVAIAMIHDPEWYNPENVGLEGTEDQAKIIADGRAEVSKFREAIMANSGKLDITISEKKLGTKHLIPKNQPLQTLSETSPQSVIGFANNDGTIINSGEAILPSQLINDEDSPVLAPGTPIDLRWVGMVNINGKLEKQYLALPTFVPQQSSKEIVETITEAMRIYLGQNDYQGKLMSVELRNKIHKQVLDITGLNIYDAAQFEQYISQFIRTEKGNFSRQDASGKYSRDNSLEAIYSFVNGKANIGTHTPFISLQKGAVVFGINNKKLAKTHAKFADPDYINRDPAGAVRGYNSFLNEISRQGNTTDTGTILPRMKLNLNQDGLRSKAPMAFINSKGEVTKGDSYENFLKTQFKTNVKSFNVGTSENPTYATLVQPVVHFTYKGDTITENTQEKVLDKPVTELTDEEIKQNLIDNADLFKKFGLDINEALGGEISFLPNYDVDTDALISQVKKELTKVSDMDIQSRNDTVRFIARQIESKVDTKYHAAISKDDVLEATKDIFEETVGKEYGRLKQAISQYTEMYNTGRFPKLAQVVNTFQNAVNQIDVIKNNWEELVNEALEEVYKSTGISEVTQTISDLIGDVLKLYNENKITLSPEGLEILKKAKKGDTDSYRDAIEIYNAVVGLSNESFGLEEIDISGDQLEGDTIGERAANYTKTSIQEDSKLTVGYILRRFLSQIPEYRFADKAPKTGFAGLTIYPGFDTYFEKIGQLLTSPVDISSSYESMIQRLKDNADTHPWVNDFLDRLEKADDQVKNAFAYSLNLHGANFKFVMHSSTKKKDKFTLQVYDTNSNEIDRVLQNQWYENFKISSLTKETDAGGYIINKEFAQGLLDEFDSWDKLKDKVPSTTQAREWLTKFGIFLSPESMKELQEKGYRVTSGNKSIVIPYKSMFLKSSTSNSVFGVLYSTLKDTINESKLNPSILDVSEGDSKGNPLNNATKLLGRLSKIERKYSKHTSTTSIRDGQKTIYGLTDQKMALQQMTRLKSDENYRNDKLSLSFDGGSYILNLMNTDMDFREKFSIDHIGINAIKELGKKLYTDNEITSISNSDHELVKVGMFQDIQQGEVKPTEVNIYGRPYSFQMRIARMFFPTMSDKSQMLDVVVPAIKLRKGNELLTNEKGDITLSDNVLSFAFSQLVEPELKRMIKHHQRAAFTGKHPNEVSNQKSFNLGAQVFLGMPEFNNLQIDGVPLPHYIAKNAEKISAEAYTDILTKIKGGANALLQDHFRQRVNNKIDVWSPFTITKSNQIVGTQFLNSSYMASFNENDIPKRLQYAAYDYVVNSYLANANTAMMFSGDPANFSQDKAFKEKGFHTDDAGNILPYAAKDGKAYSELVKNVIDINIGKRLAMLIAPGKSLVNSIGDKYVQLFLQDRTTATTNIPFLVSLYHGKEAYNTAVIKEVEGLSSDDPKIVKQNRTALQNRFPDLADYFDIESTDAQEYTTAKEAIDILYRQGRLHSSTYNTLLNKLKTQQAAEKIGQAIPKESYLSDDELKLVFQPIKPVYSGQMIDKVNDNARVMYIKSSSFPLLPQTTLGTPLDTLRRDMESIQTHTGRNVRASYDTANKVGAILGKNQLKIWDNKGQYIPMNTTELVKQLNGEANTSPLVSAMILDREHFRIQQDVPYKSSKRMEDTISIGTQGMKILFGDGVLNISDQIFDIDGQKYNGQELYQKYSDTFGNWINNEKDRLYDEVGIDKSTGKPTNITETSKKLQRILQEEATKRGYPQQDIDALSIEADGSFTLPVWLSPNSNRYEALLNSIVANRLINLKMPGNGFVVGSEEGFKTLDEYTGPKSNIVYTSAWQGELKAAEYDEEGNLIQAQVIVPSKFRNNKGELIDLIKDGYVTKDEKGNYKLDETKVSKELLSLTSFRIPTSGHVSLSQIEIAGFIPAEQGDLIIVPKNFTKQKGLDFDVDKEYAYQLWHTIEDNKLVPISSTNTKQNPRSYSKLAQNEIVKIHKAILANSDTRIQKKINKVLSMDFARSQATLISQANNAPTHTFSIYDDEHQKYKLGLGAAGKSGIGVYSNYVVFHNLVQQSATPIQLMDSDSETKQRFPLEITIGSFTSNGKLGNIETLDKNRTIGEVLAERQNTATDNEKEQIMGRVGVNDLTIGVDSLLTALGFDKAKLENGKEISIPYLLLSQPIIKDYVAGIKATRSTTSGFQQDAEKSVIDKLMIDYQTNIEDQHERLNKELTGQLLFDNLTKPSNEHQQAILEMFMKLKGYAKEISQIQGRLNIQNSGLGKSIFEMLEKYQNVGRMASNFKVAGISGLVGEFKSGEDFTNTPNSELIEQGYHIFDTNDGQFAVKPTTPVGHILVNATESGYELWGDFFPHQHPIIQNTFDNILSQISDEEISEAKRIQHKYDIMQEMKKYLFSSSILGLYSGDPQIERVRLFKDSENNTSLATYLSKVEQINSPSANLVGTNKLISAFTYQLNKNGELSLFKYDTARGEDTNEEYKYLALVELMDKNEVIKDEKGNPILYNGKEYTTRQLAKDMIIYTYLQGGIQKATEIVKYVPISYLKASGFAATTRQWQLAAKLGNMQLSSGQEYWSAMLGHNLNQVGRFERQYIQHNPGKVTQVSVKDMESSNSTKLDNLTQFTLKSESEKNTRNFVHLHISKDNKLLFERGDNGIYRRIPVLGASGLSEYSIRSSIYQSIINPQVSTPSINTTIVPTNTSVSNTSRLTLYGLNKENLTGTLTDLSKDSNLPEGYRQLAAIIIPFLNQSTQLKIQEYEDKPVRGGFNPNTNTVFITPQHLGDAKMTNKDIAETILHEVIHSLTKKELNKYMNDDGSWKEGQGLATVPAHISKLHRVFTEAQKVIGEDKIKEFIAQGGKVKSQSDYLLYAGADVNEFLAMMMSPDVREQLSKAPYKQTGKTILQEFIDTIKKILEAIGVPVNTISSHAFESIFEVAQAQKESNKITTKPKDHAMSYKMPPEQNLTGKWTTTLELAEQGIRTATTRSFALGEVGDIITFEGRPQQYRITEIEKLTPDKIHDEAWIEKWSQKEQWTVGHFKSVLGGKTVHVNSFQTSFEKVEANSTEKKGNFDLNSQIDEAQSQVDEQKTMNDPESTSDDIAATLFPNVDNEIEQALKLIDNC